MAWMNNYIRATSMVLVGSVAFSIWDRPAGDSTCPAPAFCIAEPVAPRPDSDHTHSETEVPWHLSYSPGGMIGASGNNNNNTFGV